MDIGDCEQTSLATYHNNSIIRSCMVRRSVQKPEAAVLVMLSPYEDRTVRYTSISRVSYRLRQIVMWREINLTF